jgi:hypothetical protein
MKKWINKNLDKNLFIMIFFYLAFLFAFVIMWPHYSKEDKKLECIDELQLRLETDGPSAPPPPATPKGMNGPMQCKADLHSSYF